MSDIDRAFAPIIALLARFHAGRHGYIRRLMDEDRHPSIETMTGRILSRRERDQFLADNPHSSDDEDPWFDEEIIESLYWDEFPDLLRDSSLYWVSEDMCQIIGHAARQLPETVTWHPELIPAQFGAVVLDDPLSVPPNRAPDIGDEENADTATRIIWWHLLPRGVTLLFAKGLHPHADDPVLTMRHGFTQIYHHDELDIVGYLSWLTAFWLFIDQRIPATQTRRASRQMRRHDLKDAPLLHSTTCVTLRRREQRIDEPRPTDIEWTHRWLVTGHWRNQFYPSSGQHSPVWIAPYVKGPDDLPLVPKDRAFVGVAMIELVVIVVAGLVILEAVYEIFQRLDRRDAERYEARSRARLLEELRRQR